MKKSRTVSSNIPRLSLSLFSRTLIFFFKNIQSLQSKLQVCSLIQSFSNSRFMYLFLALYIIEFLKFLNFLEKSDLNRSLCVCVYGKVRIQKSSCCYLGFAMKAQSEICGSLGRTLATLRYRESEGEKKTLRHRLKAINNVSHRQNTVWSIKGKESNRLKKKIKERLLHGERRKKDREKRETE